MAFPVTNNGCLSRISVGNDGAESVRRLAIGSAHSTPDIHVDTAIGTRAITRTSSHISDKLKSIVMVNLAYLSRSKYLK